MKTQYDELQFDELLTRAVHIRLSKSMYRNLAKYCKKKGVPASIVVRNLIRDFLDPAGIEL